jgi:hypothetical protein
MNTSYKIVNRFVFEFSDEENEQIHIYQFKFLVGLTSKIEESKEFHQQVDAMEQKYGVHDITGADPDDAISYTSYEIDPERYKKLMEEWREFFSQAGYPAKEIEGPNTHPWQ